MKRIISTILALSLLCGLLPAISLAADTRETLVFSFLKKDNNNISDATKFSYSKGNGNLEYFDCNYSHSTSNDFLAWDGASSSPRFSMYQWGYLSKHYNYAAYKIKGIEKGEYTITLDYAEHSAGTQDVEMYLFDPSKAAELIAGTTTIKDEINNAANVPFFADVNMYSATAGSGKVSKRVTMKEAGEYIIVFIRRSKDGSQCTTPKSLTFKPYVVPVFEEVVHNLEDTAFVGKEIEFSAQINTPREIFIPEKEGDGLQVSVSDSDVAEIIGGTYVNGVYTAKIKTKTTGNVDIQFKATVDGETTDVIHPFSVVEIPEPYEFDISFASSSWPGISTPADFTYENTAGLIEWLGTSSTNTTKYNFEGAGAFYNLSPGKYAAYKIYFPAEGKHSVELNYIVSSAAGTVADVYLIPGVAKNISSAIASAAPVFKNVNFYSTTNPGSKKIKAVFENTNAGDYTLVFVARETTEPTNGFAVRPAKLTVKPYVKPEYGSIVHNLSASEVAENSIPVSVYMLQTDDYIFVPSIDRDGITVTSQNPDIAEITDIAVNDGVITATLVTKKAGEASFLFTTVFEANPYYYTHTMEITEAVEPSPVQIEMTQSTIKFDDKTAPSEAWETDGFELVLDSGKMTSSKTSRYTPRFIGTKYFVQLSTGSGLWPTKKAAQFTIKRKILASGYYKVDFTGVRLNQSADYSIYVNGQYAGDFIFNDYNATDSGRSLYTVTKSLNTIYLPYGDVEISFRARRNNQNTDAYFVPYYISFTPLEENEAPVFDHVTSNLSAMVPVGDSERASLSVVMSDGSNRHFGLLNNGKKDTLNDIKSIEAEDKSIAEVGDVVISEIGDTENVFFTVTGKETGTTNIKVTALIDGEEVTDTIPVEIIAKPILHKVGLSFGDDTLPATRKTETKLSLTRSTDFKEYVYDYSVKYRSSDDKIATVDEETGEITGVKAGNAKIYADVTDWDNNVVTGYADISILPEPVLESIELDVNTSLLVGDSSQLSVKPVMDDGLEGNIADYELSYESSDEAVATIDANGLVRGISEGEANITVIAIKENGNRCSKVIKVYVYDEITPLVIDFSQTVLGSNSKVPEATPGYTIKTSISSNANFKIYNCGGKNMLQVYSGGNIWPITSTRFVNAAFAIEIDARVEGDYALSFEGGIFYVNSNYSVFVNGQYAGDYKFRDPKPVTYRDIGEVKTLNSVHLNEGKNEIIIAARDKVEGETPYMLLRQMTFTPLGFDVDFGKIDVDVPEVISVGESIDLSAYVFMNDESLRHFGPSYSGTLVDEKNRVVLSDAKNLVSVNAHTPGILADGKNDFTITGKAPGETVLTFTVYIDGKESIKEFPVEVVSEPLVSTGARVEAKTLYAGDASRLIATPKLLNGHIIDAASAINSFESLTPEIADITGDDANILQTYKAGTAKIKVTSTFNGVTVDDVVEIGIEEAGFTEFIVTAGGSERIRLTDKGCEDTVPIYITAYDNLGDELDTTDIIISATAKNPEYATVDSSNNRFVPVAEGNAYFDVTIELDGRVRTLEDVLIPVVYGKSRSTYYTAEEARIARENVKKYAWAEKNVASYVKSAENYLGQLDAIYAMIPSQGVPRSIATGQYNDPYGWSCRFCGINLMEEYGQFSWKHDPINRPWKVQCPDCKRLFPSNDFESFYELGLNEYGEFDRMHALEAHREMMLKKGLLDLSVTDPGVEHSKAWKEYYGYGIKGGFLYNELYTDLDEVKTLNGGEGLRDYETEETWGVDDSWGYIPADDEGKIHYFSNGEPERHTYIAEYVHFGLFRQEGATTGAVVQKAISTCANAYFYTGEVKYGRVAAILLDRLADFYKDYDLRPFGNLFANTDGGLNTGKMVGCIWECEEVARLATAYDMIYDVFDKDPYTVDYLRNKSKTIKMRHSKDTAAQIRTNIEDGYIRPALEGLRDCSVSGNFGLPQKANAICAVVLDSMPETAEWLDYLMAPGWVRSATQECRGGGVNEVLMDRIDADGQGDEASQYNRNWSSALIEIQEIFDNYDRYDKVNLFNNVKFVQLFYAYIPMMSTNYTPQIGDSGTTCGTGHWGNVSSARNGWEKLKDPLFAQVMYELNGRSSRGLFYDITVENPESLQDEVQEVIDTYGPLNQGSGAMTNFGLGILRDYGDYTDTNTTTAKDVSRDVWMYFGSNSGHGHLDTLNLGLTAFGLNMLPDHGYPKLTGSDPERMQWTRTTINHNTVLVNEEEQSENAETRGKMKHFDDDGQVKVMDVAADYVYKATRQYRRSLVMVRVNDDVSYTVDFFRVLGGDTHTYSLHATSNTISETDGLSLIPQVDASGEYVGTYAGKNVPFGKDSAKPAHPKGYTWLRNVDRDESPEDAFEVDFEIRDFKKNIKDSKGLHLRMMVLNGGNVARGASANVAIADGLPPQAAKNKEVDKLKYVLLENSGKNLDTVFTTVFEPYRTNRYLEASSELPIEVADGFESDGDASRAIKVVHVDGRVDYIFYATNNTVTYKVTDEIAGESKDILFRGFVGVYTVNGDGENIYKYVHDGDIIGKPEVVSTATVEGVVKDFTKEISTDNKITLIPERDLTDEEIEDISDRYIFIDNGDLTRSGTFRIYDAEQSGEDIVLSVGKISPIRRNKDSFNTELGYIYTIAEGQTARIPATYSEDFAPYFDPISSSLSVSAGSSISVPLKANSDLGKSVTYSGNTLPRGASIDGATGTVTWKPDSSQVGRNHFAVTATDESGRQSTVHFYITVYGSTTGGSKNEETGTTDTPPAGGGGGGASPTPEDSSKDDAGDVSSDVPQDNTDASDSTNAGNGENIAPQFADLSNHTWASDAINKLATAGIIKGTSEITFSPANNITRADFALLLVRAFDLKSDNTENFADVSASDYFAAELAIARNNGIVGGIGENKFAPRNSVTRQDMMVIVYRALQKLNVELGIDDEPKYADFTIVAEYAKPAVSALIGAGIVNGKNNLIAPTDYTTRAEVAVLIKRILDYIK